MPGENPRQGKNGRGRAVLSGDDFVVAQFDDLFLGVAQPGENRVRILAEQGCAFNFGREVGKFHRHADGQIFAAFDLLHFDDGAVFAQRTVVFNFLQAQHRSAGNARLAQFGNRFEFVFADGELLNFPVDFFPLLAR